VIRRRQHQAIRRLGAFQARRRAGGRNGAPAGADQPDRHVRAPADVGDHLAEVGSVLRRQAETDQTVFAAVVRWRINQRSSETETVKVVAESNQ
jgi:hypothetical protein